MAGASEFSAAAPTHVRGRVAHYRVVEPLGEGGMGVVLLARDETLGRNVALKLLTPRFADDVQFRARFMRESRLAAAIDHPNIIPIYEAGEADGQLFIAMRYVGGVDLRELLAAEGPFSLDRAISLLDQMARALDAAHAAGLVHRDVKPGNVLIDRSEGREHCYLTDFGLTKNIASSSGYTETGQFFGTLSYMAPEQIEGHHVDGRADLYALGCVMFECLTGLPPFRRDSDVAMMYAHLNEPPPSLSAARPDLPAAVDTVLMRAMAKAPGDRHATCLDLVAELQATIAGVPVRPFAPSSVGAGTRRRFARSAPPPLPSNVSTRGERAAAMPPAPPSFAPPSPPRVRPPRPAQLAPRPARNYTRPALIIALAILLTAGGIAAALLLRNSDSGPSQQQLLDRTNKLSRDLEQLNSKVEAGDRLNAARLLDEQRAARQLIKDSQRQQAAFNKSLADANTQYLAALEALYAFTQDGRHGHIRDSKKYARAGNKKRQDAQTHMPTDRGPVSHPGPGRVQKPGTSSTREVFVPKDAVGTISAPAGDAIKSVTDVGDVSGDGATDVAVVTDKAAYVVFGGNSGGGVKLGSLTLGDSHGVPVPGATDLAPAGNFDNNGPDDLVAIKDHSAYVVTDLAQPVDFATATPLATGASSVGKAGDLNNDGAGDLAVADGHGTVTVHLGNDAGTFDISGGGTGFGASLASISDVNGDGHDDLLIGSPREDIAYVIFSSDSPTSFDVSNMTGKGFKITTSHPGSGLGTALADLGGGDILVTAPGASPKARHGAGAAYVIHGAGNRDDLNVDSFGAKGYEIDGPRASGGFGSSAAFAGDAGAVIGTAGNAAALAYVVPTPSSSHTVDLLNAASATGIHGTPAGSGTNHVAGNVDFDGSGQPEVLVPADGGNAAYVLPVKP